MRYTKAIVQERFMNLIHAFKDVFFLDACDIRINMPDRETRYEVVLYFKNGYHFELYGNGYETAMQLRAVRETLEAIGGNHD